MNISILIRCAAESSTSWPNGLFEYISGVEALVGPQQELEIFIDRAFEIGG
jgi:hypothetical protein